MHVAKPIEPQELMKAEQLWFTPARRDDPYFPDPMIP
jgi:hypothetical protein